MGMKVIKSNGISAFGGLNFVLNDFEKLGLGALINSNLPSLPKQSKYKWKDIFYSFWSIFFCGGDCAEDLAINLSNSFRSNPFMLIPSPDRILERMKDLSQDTQIFEAKRGKSTHEFNFNDSLTQLNLQLLKRTHLIQDKQVVLDYDNTNIFSRKSDAKYTYHKKQGYTPGVGFIGPTVVYVENRNGNSDAQTLQQDTLERMFFKLEDNGIKVESFRADSASYQFDTLNVISNHSERFYIRARMNESLYEAISKINNWTELIINGQKHYRGSTDFIPFEKIAKRTKQEDLLKCCRLIVTKQKRDDGQINAFTQEACSYSTIVTNDMIMSDDQVVMFYNQRGAIEREFDVLKNDFGWNHMPFSKLQYNTVFLIITAICRNLYNYIINKFSQIHAHLSKSFRIKKFIYRFICIPAKWIITGRMKKLKIYGELHYKT